MQLRGPFLKPYSKYKNETSILNKIDNTGLEVSDDFIIDKGFNFGGKKIKKEFQELRVQE